ncbi:unnamed protein product [Mytilus coruscus]|uniref:SMB domain-containing protein n=1 Tax=Mytilus coruscus TaxID=42192 RepID=A0A6J8E466_MYTCO|nr:unnamed protein product [Mytilus coruscus]
MKRLFRCEISLSKADKSSNSYNASAYYFQGENCYCFKADELATNAIDDKSPQKCLSSCSTCSENYIFIYKFNVTESCVGRCGQLYDKRDPCQCNTACKKYKNCCDDYDAFCLIESCVGRCEQPFDSNLQCQCNSPCREKQDCCDDYGVFCSEAENMDSDNRDPTHTKMCMALHCGHSDHHSLSPENCDFQFKVSCGYNYRFLKWSTAVAASTKSNATIDKIMK